MNPAWLTAVIVLPLLVLIVQLLWAIYARDREIAILRKIIAGRWSRMRIVPSANSSGPHEATDSQKSANGK